MLTLLLMSMLATPTTDRPADFVDVEEVAEGVVVEARYFGADNFVGAKVDGYLAPKCLLSGKAATALAKVQARLTKMHLRLRIYDCYRPQRAVDHFVRWAKDPTLVGTRKRYYPNVPKTQLFKRGYIASRSGHSRGSTVDLTIDGLDMGTGWDYLDPLSHTANASMTPQVRANRLLLKSIMERHGFRNYSKEWWHYSLRREPYPKTFFDFVVE